MKDACVVCNKPILNPKENYRSRGNFCLVCNAQAGVRVKENIDKRNNK